MVRSLLPFWYLKYPYTSKFDPHSKFNFLIIFLVRFSTLIVRISNLQLYLTPTLTHMQNFKILATVVPRGLWISHSQSQSSISYKLNAVFTKILRPFIHKNAGIGVICHRKLAERKSVNDFQRTSITNKMQLIMLYKTLCWGYYDFDWTKMFVTPLNLGSLPTILL